jgi:tetratricopeptide (TPR) repeat protein
MRDGFAIYFSNLSYDRVKYELIYEENLSWLETVKSWGNNAPSIESIMMADINGIPNNFQPASWALVSFLMNNENEEYRRLLFEAFMLLSPNATSAENTLTIMQRVASWINTDTLQQDYTEYFASRMTFAGFIEEGRRAYDAKDLATAEKYFLSALEMRKDHYAPHYYLGLLAYEAKNYDAAEQYYRSSLQYGADQALLQYAMGLNALSANRTNDARIFLRQASALSPERYAARVEELLRRVE